MSQVFRYYGHQACSTAVCTALTAAGYLPAEEDEAEDFSIIYYPNADEAEDFFFGDDGILFAVPKGTLLIDLSPSTLSFVRELSSVATVSDLHYIEAPLAVINPFAADPYADPLGLKCFVACDEECRLEACEIISCFADDVAFMGATGSAQLARALFTVQQVAQVLSAVEADALQGAAHADTLMEGELDVKVQPHSDLIAEGLAAIAQRRFTSPYTCEILLNEVAAAASVADDASFILPQLEAELNMLTLFVVIGGFDMAPAALSLMYCDDETVKKAGLDWSRADVLYEQHGDGCGDDCGHDHDGGFDDFPGGFTAYSPN